MGPNPQRFGFKYNEQAPLCIKIKATIAEQIKTLYAKDVTRFYVGCAVGVDTWAAEAVIELKKQSEFSKIELYCEIPFPGHDEKFTARQKKRYQRTLELCSSKEIINNHYSPVAYKRLNYRLIDSARYLIAVYDQDKSERSGLTQTVNYAVKNIRSVICIHPDTAEVSLYSP
jgi:uncharacterized phage-like protein YoqJ